MSLYEGSVKRPIFTALCFVAVVVFGLFSYSKLPIDQLPDIESNTIMVFTYYNGANASDIENNVTRPLENTLNSCSHIKHITSILHHVHRRTYRSLLLSLSSATPLMTLPTMCVTS